MEKFCSSGDPSFLNKLTQDQANEIKKILGTIKVNNIPKDRLKFWYILSTYFDIGIPLKNNIKVNITNFCDILSSEIIPASNLEMMFYLVYTNIVKTGLKVDLSNISDNFLLKLYQEIDTVYFNKELSRLCKEKNTHVKLTVTDKFKTGVAGHCRKDGFCSYVLAMNIPTHREPFIKYSSQKNGGIECYNPLECLMRTLQHEIVHLIIENFCPVPRHAMHGKVFQAIALYRFGQTDFRHILGREEGTGMERSDMVNWKTVSFNSKGKKYNGWIIEFLPRNVKVLLQNNSTIKVPYALILPEQPNIGEKPHMHTKDTMKGWSTFTAKIGGIEKRLTIVKLNKINIIAKLDNRVYKVPYGLVIGK